MNDFSITHRMLFRILASLVVLEGALIQDGQAGGVSASGKAGNGLDR